jgi:ABC-type lipoprotein release transport system permease subunit
MTFLPKLKWAKMVFGLDSDANVALGLSMLIISFNVVFVTVIFVYFCCYIEIVSLSPASRVAATKKTSSMSLHHFDTEKRWESHDLLK